MKFKCLPREGNKMDSWIDNRKAYTYEKIAELIGCTPMTVRRIVDQRGFTVLKGKRGRNGFPSLVLLSDANLKGLYQDGINLARNTDGSCHGRKWENLGNCGLAREQRKQQNSSVFGNGVKQDTYHVLYTIALNYTEYFCMNGIVYKIASDHIYDCNSSTPKIKLIEYHNIKEVYIPCCDIVNTKIQGRFSFVKVQNNKGEFISFSKHTKFTQEAIHNLFLTDELSIK
jgi:hypothetical protein